MREDWIECCFEDLLDYEQPTKYIVKSTKYNDRYKIPVLTAGKTFIKGYTNETEGIFDNLPTIIFDDFTTATQFVNFKFKVKSSAMKILVPKSKLVNMPLVYYAMQVNQVRSDTHKRYWISVFAKKKFLLPPLIEQKAIVKKIEELFSSLVNGITDLKKAQNQLIIYRQAVLKKMFEGDWEITSLEKIAKWGSGGTPSRGNSDFYTGHIPWLKTGELGAKYVSDSKEKITDEAIKKSSAKIFPANSVGIAMYGATIGKVSIFSKPLSTNQACAVAQPYKSTDKEFLYYYLASQKFDFITKGKGGAQPNISQTILKAHPIPLPTIKEQKKIVQEIESRLIVCDKVEESINESLQKAIALNKSILKKAFDGTLLNEEEINQCKADKDYEPASVLLQKIKAEQKQN
jgi:type I restriction enzyme S subunit